MPLFPRSVKAVGSQNVSNGEPGTERGAEPRKENPTRKRQPEKEAKTHKASKKARRAESESEEDWVDSADKETAPSSTEPGIGQLVVGATVMCVVAEISENHLVVDLPRNESGVVDAEHTCEADCVPSSNLSQRFSPFQVLVGVVIAEKPYTKQNWKASLKYSVSLRPSQINLGKDSAFQPTKNQFLALSVISLEEHGLMATLGNPSVNSKLRFFVKTDAKGYSIGQLVYAVVDSVKEAQGLVVCRIEAELPGRFIRSNVVVNKGDLTPGQLLECKVYSVDSFSGETRKNNRSSSKILSAFPVHTDSRRSLATLLPNPSRVISVNFCGALTGQIPLGHERNPFLSRTEQKLSDLSLSSTCLARILCVNGMATGRSAPRIYLTLLPHLVEFSVSQALRSNMDSRRVGSLVRGARVLGLDKFSGVQLACRASADEPAKQALPSQEDAGLHSTRTVAENFRKWNLCVDSCCLLNCPKSLVADEPEDAEREIRSLKVGQKKDCRILQRNACEWSFTVALRSKYTGDALVVLEQVKAGQIVQGSVSRTFDWGFFVALSEEISGRLRMEHLSDSRIKQIPSKYCEGYKSRFRVLNVNLGLRGLSLTRKEMFLKVTREELEKQLNPTLVKVNDKFTLYVSAVKPKGLLMRGFQDFWALLPYEELNLGVFASEEECQAHREQRTEVVAGLKFSLGVTKRARVTRISRGREGRLLILLSLDLDKVSLVEEATHLDAGLQSLTVLPLDGKIRTAHSRGWLDVENKSYEELVEDALRLLPVGTEIEGVVRNIHEASQTMQLSLGPLVCAIHSTEISDDLSDLPLTRFRLGETVKARVIGPAPIKLAKTLRIFLNGSMRSSPTTLPQNVAELAVGQKYPGIVFSVDFSGLLVAVSSQVKLRVRFCYLAGPKWEESAKEGVDARERAQTVFPPGTWLKDLIVYSVSVARGQAEGTLKRDEFLAVLALQGPDIVTFKSVDVGKSYAGTIAGIAEFGIFVLLENSDGDLTVLCHKKDVFEDGKHVDPAAVYKVGDFVLVKVLRKDEERRRIAVGMKASYFKPEEFQNLGGSPTDEQEQGKEEISMAKEQEEEEESVAQSKPTAESPAPATPSTTHTDEGSAARADDWCFGESRDWMDENWRPDTLSGREIDWRHDFPTKSNPVDQEKKKMKDKPGQKERPGQKEKRIRQSEKEIAGGEWAENPCTSDDFERLILVKGDDSDVWIQYMAYFAELGDHSRAVDTAQRGIASIDYSKDKERQRIWLAWLNLEDLLGSEQSFLDTCKEALRSNEPKAVFLHILDLLEARHRVEPAERLAAQMVKKVPKDAACWTRYIKLIYAKPGHEAATAGLAAPRILTVSEGKEVSKLVRRALDNLPPTEHVTFRCGLARLDYLFGMAESGRAKFLDILAAKPKRTDVWATLLDCQVSLLKSGATAPRGELVQATRMLLRSATSVELKPKKMKPLFDRWLKFETEFGNAVGMEECKEKARQYVALQKSGVEGGE